MSLPEISALFRERYENKSSLLRLAIFLGAGSDFSSGGVSFIEFKRQFCNKYSDSKFFKSSSEARIDSTFQNIICDELERSDRGHIIEQLFRDLGALEPSDAYKLLVLLASRDAIDAIVTTNFDNMLERAEISLGKNVFQGFGPGLAKPFEYNPEVRPNKVPYLKLHGDLASRRVTKLTQRELDEGIYDKDIIDLFRSILQSHTIIICGYSGYDDALSTIISGNADQNRRIYWCNPNKVSDEAPLVQKLKEHNVKLVKTTFDELIRAIAKPILSLPFCDGYSPVLIRDLLEWRLDYYRKEFYDEHWSEHVFRKGIQPVPRSEAETELRNFLNSDRPLAIISGKSGVGKSILGINLQNWAARQLGYLFFFIKAKSLDKPELDVHITQALGGLGSEAPLAISTLEHWLRNKNLFLIIFLDGLNEFSAEIDNCIVLFRSILRLILQLRPNSPIKLILTVRQETWQRLTSFVDQFFLSKILWSDGKTDRVFTTLILDNFTPEELTEAIKRISLSFPLEDKYWPSDIDRLRDPFLFKIIYNNLELFSKTQSTLKAFDFAIQEKLAKCGAVLHPLVLNSVLANIALSCLSSHKGVFNLNDFIPPNTHASLEDSLIDVSLLKREEDGRFRFSHDRVQEYFLSKAFGYSPAPDLENVDSLIKFLKEYSSNPIAYTAAQVYFVLNPESVESLGEAFRISCDKETNLLTEEKELLHSFTKEVFVEVLDDNPNYLGDVMADFLHPQIIREFGQEHLRSLILIVAHLPGEMGTNLLNNISHCCESLVALEAEMFQTDKIIKAFLTRCDHEIDLFMETPFSEHFCDSKLSNWYKLGRLIGFVSKLGPVNLNKTEYSIFFHSATNAFKKFRETAYLKKKDCEELSVYILTYCNRLFFNATSEEINRFFKNDKRFEFLPIFSQLQDGNVLDRNKYNIFLPYVRRYGNNCEFHLSKLAFILSSVNNFEKTLQLWEEIFKDFNDSSPPEEIDFLQATLPYLFVVNEVDYDNKFDKYFEKILRDWPTILLHAPGLVRSGWRNLGDEFDLIFEDGFNPIASYIYLKPSAKRKSLSYKDYLFSMVNQKLDEKSLYVRYLREYLKKGDVQKALRIIHAICSHIMLWPEDGMPYLQIIADSLNPLIRRAYIRVLAECYHRYPLETLKYINKYGNNLDEEEIRRIKIRVDPQIGYRQIEDLEWANIAHFFIKAGKKNGYIYSAIKKIINSKNLQEAVCNFFQEIQLVLD